MFAIKINYFFVVLIGMYSIFRSNDHQDLGKEVYRSSAIKVPEKLQVRHGLPGEVNVVTDRIASDAYVNRIACVVFPGFWCWHKLTKHFSPELSPHNTPDEAMQAASQLEIDIRQLLQDEAKHEFSVSAARAGVPFYYIRTDDSTKYVRLVAQKIPKNGNSGRDLSPNSTPAYLITCLTPFGTQKLFYPYGGPAGFLDHNVKDLFPLIAEIEEELNHRYYATDGFFINAFSFSHLTGIRKGGWADYFETPVNFFKVHVGKQVRIKT